MLCVPAARESNHVGARREREQGGISLCTRGLPWRARASKLLAGLQNCAQTSKEKKTFIAVFPAGKPGTA